MDTAGAHELDAEYSCFKRDYRWSVGILLVSRSSRSVGRHQLALAAVWDCEPVAGGGGAGGGDDDSDENGEAEVDLGDAAADGVAGNYHHGGELSENFQRQRAHRIFGASGCAGGTVDRGEDCGGQSGGDAE